MKGKRPKRAKRGGKESICPAEAGGTTPGTQPDSASAGPVRGNPKFSESDGPQRDFSFANFLTELAACEHEVIAEQIGRSNDFATEQQFQSFVEARDCWAAADRRDCERRLGKSVALRWCQLRPAEFVEIVRRVWKRRRRDPACAFNPFTTFEIARQVVGDAVHFYSLGGAEGWQQSFLDLCKNPLIPKPQLLTMNAKAIWVSAENGDWEFFTKLGQAFRPDRTRKRILGGGDCQEWALRLWLPAGLWRMETDKDGHERLSQALETLANYATARGAPPSANLIGRSFTPDGYRMALKRLGLTKRERKRKGK